MKHIAKLFLALALVLPIASCGTLMFEERKHQEHSGKLDPNIVILDAIGLLFFLVPGVVAFMIDYSNDTIYLPKGVDKGEGPFIK